MLSIYFFITIATAATAATTVGGDISLNFGQWYSSLQRLSEKSSFETMRDNE